MRNQKGVTLLELLGVLAITGIIIAMIMTTMANGSNASQRTKSKQQMQQEANYIVEVIRSEYLKKENNVIELKVEGTGYDQKLKMNLKVISQGYNYKLIQPNNGLIDPNQNQKFKLELSSSGVQKFKINTSFSKLR